MTPTASLLLVYGLAFVVWIVFAILALRNALTARKIGARIMPFMILFVVITVALASLSVYYGFQGQSTIQSPPTKVETNYY